MRFQHTLIGVLVSVLIAACGAPPDPNACTTDDDCMDGYTCDYVDTCNTDCSSFGGCKTGYICSFSECIEESEEGPGEDASEALCSNTCNYPGDGECDDGGVGSDYSVCAFGTDCDDCGPRDASDAAGAGGGGGATGGGGVDEDECDYDTQCPSQEACIASRCQPVECTSDSHCSGCNRCIGHYCSYCGEGPYGCYC